MALAVLAPVLNWLTSGDHLLKTLGESYWPVAGMDLLLLVQGLHRALHSSENRLDQQLSGVNSS